MVFFWEGRKEEKGKGAVPDCATFPCSTEKWCWFWAAPEQAEVLPAGVRVQPGQWEEPREHPQTLGCPYLVWMCCRDLVFAHILSAGADCC